MKAAMNALNRRKEAEKVEWVIRKFKVIKKFMRMR